jgi:hypothetical protein
MPGAVYRQRQQRLRRGAPPLAFGEQDRVEGELEIGAAGESGQQRRAPHRSEVGLVVGG